MGHKSQFPDDGPFYPDGLALLGQRPRTPGLPVLFLHGLAGFSKLLGIRYARNWYRIACKRGIQLHTPWTIPAGTVRERCERAMHYIDQHLPDGPFHIIGHSMGGLDARYLVSRLGLGDRVPTVVTLGTPHRGNTAIQGPAWWAPRIGREWDLPTAFNELTPDRLRRFNEDVPDHPGVRYYSWAGRWPWWRITPLLWQLSYPLQREDGPGDGLVSDLSARWGVFMGWVPLSHFGLVGWRLRPSRFGYWWAGRLSEWVYDVLAQVENQATGSCDRSSRAQPENPDC